MLLGACAAPAPQVVEKVVTQVVEKEKARRPDPSGREAGEQVVEKEVQVTADP